MGFAIEVVVGLGRIVLGFYGFWLVWRGRCRGSPARRDAKDRIAPYACYLTDPFLLPVARWTRLPTRVLAVVALVGVAAALAALATLPG